MEILNKKYALLTNCEVMKIVESSWEEKKKGKGLKNLATICYETLQYLTECPAPIKIQTTEKIIEFRTEMRRFKLSDTEIFMLVNDPPSSLLHIQLMVDNSEERLTEDQITEILQITERLLLPPTVEESSDQTENSRDLEIDEGGGDDDDDEENEPQPDVEPPK